MESAINMESSINLGSFIFSALPILFLVGIVVFVAFKYLK